MISRIQIGAWVAGTALASGMLWAQAGIDRTVLPIQQPARPVLTGLDARTVTPPHGSK
jgi:hypothetical protein